VGGGANQKRCEELRLIKIRGAHDRTGKRSAGEVLGDLHRQKILKRIDQLSSRRLAKRRELSLARTTAYKIHPKLVALTKNRPTLTTSTTVKEVVGTLKKVENTK